MRISNPHTKLLSLLILSFLSACSPRDTTSADTLIIGQSAEPRSLDPHVTTATSDFRIMENIYEGLVRFEEGSLQIDPGLAHTWNISDDGLRYSFTLHNNITFHDGTPLDSTAVKFNFQRMLDPEHPFHFTGPFPLSFFFSMIEEIETPDSQTVVFHLSEPFAPFLASLASPVGYIVSPTAIRQHGSEYGRNPIGTGPFRFAEWQSQRRVVLERNDSYHGTSPNLRQLLFRPLTDENARLTELLSGGCDLILEVPADLIAYFRDHPEYEVAEAAGPHLWFIILNLKEGPFRDPLLRAAANMAIDREGITRHLLQDTAIPAYSPFPAAFEIPGSNEPVSHNPDLARNLVAESEYNGEVITFLVPESGSGMLEPRAMAEAIQGDLANIGITVELQTFEWNTYLSKVNGGLEGSGDMAQMAWMTNDPDTLPYLALRSEAWPEKGGFNSGYFSNPQIDTILQQARQSTDPSQRTQLYSDVDRIFRKELPWLVVASWRQNAVHHKNVQNFQLEPSFLFRLKNVRKTK